MIAISASAVRGVRACCPTPWCWIAGTASSRDAQGEIDWDDDAVLIAVASSVLSNSASVQWSFGIMDRRRFIKTSALAGLSASLPLSGRAAQGGFRPSPANGWRVFEVTTLVKPVTAGQETTVWIPLPSIEHPEWIKPMGSEWQGNAARAGIAEDRCTAKMLVAQWRAGQDKPEIEVISRFATRDRATI
jgi:hypothetical protein